VYEIAKVSVLVQCAWYNTTNFVLKGVSISRREISLGLVVKGARMYLKAPPGPGQEFSEEKALSNSSSTARDIIDCRTIIARENCTWFQ